MTEGWVIAMIASGTGSMNVMLLCRVPRITTSRNSRRMRPMSSSRVMARRACVFVSPNLDSK